MFRLFACALVALGVLAPAATGAQATLDRVDPARVERTMPADARPAGTLPVAIAPAPAATPIASDLPITVGAVAITGLGLLHASDFADIVETYVGRTLSPAALAGLADAISERARARGYLFATTTIPPQKIEAGLLRLALEEGRVDEVRIAGTDNRAARAALEPLVGGAVTSAALQRRLLIAADIDGLLLRRVRLLREGPRNVLFVEMGERRVSGVADLDNSGSRPIGPLRTDISVRLSQLLAADDAVTFTAATNPLMPQELGYGRVRYVKRVGVDGTEVSASASYASVAPGSYLADRDIVGRSWTAQLGIARPLLRRRATSIWLQAAFDIRSVKQDWAGELARRDRVSSFRLGLYGYATLAGGVLRASATLSQGAALFDATRAGDPLASRPDADGGYTSLLVTTNWDGRLSGPISADIALAGQIAGEPLLIAEQFGLGGGTYLRPYDYNERSGDDGVAGSVELRYALAKTAGPLREPLVYIFASGGYTGAIRGDAIAGPLFASGGGVRSTIGTSFSADAGIAFPLSGPRYDTGSSDPVFNMRLSKRF
jgi:hemolysin activation/secretion protein